MADERCPSCGHTLPSRRRITASEVAKRTGFTLATLSKRRRLGLPPHGWIYVSSTLVTYPEEEVEQFLHSRPNPHAYLKHVNDPDDGDDE